MKKIELLHGSDHIIKIPSYGEGKINNDYGRGFYCTQDFDLAGEWACRHGSDGYINRYILDTEKLNVLDLCDGNHSVLEWIAILLQNRTFRLSGDLAQETRTYIIDNFSVDVSKYDLIRGYRADDSYFQFAEAFVENTISVSRLSQAMHLGNLGIQIALVSKKSFKHIKYEGTTKVSGGDYYPRFITRDQKARRDYKDSLSKKNNYRNEIFALDILREEMRRKDERIQRTIRK